MPIKIQNFLFLLGFSYIVALVYIEYASFYEMLFGANLELLAQILFIIPNVAIALGLMNMCSDKMAQYIYNENRKSHPRVYWYCMFIAWLETFVVFLLWIDRFSFLYLINAFVISYALARIFYPNRTREKRIISACIFLFILVALNF